MKIAKSALLILAVLALAGGATGAYFSDQESIAGNTYSTGTLNISLNHLVGKPFNISNAYPGLDSSWKYMDILNSPGTLPVESFVWLAKTGGSDELYNFLNINLYDSGWNSVCGGGDDVRIFTGPLSSITGQGNRIQTSNYDPDAAGTPGNDDIRAGQSQRICQTLWLPSWAPNSLQGQSIEFTEYVDAEQNNDF